MSLSHGEGWDMPMSEAAASDLRLIAPDHSAYRSYLDASTARLLPSRETPAIFPFNGMAAHLFVGLQWWQPDEDAAVAAIRDAIDGRDTPVASARARMERDFTWGQATSRMVELLTEAEDQAPAPRLWSTLQGYIGRTTGRARSPQAALQFGRPQ